MNDTATSPAPPQRKCAIEEVFEASFIELLKLVPTNPFVRAWVLKLGGKMPPIECVTFEQLKDWVEFNCTKRLRRSQSAANGTTESPGISIAVDFSEQEYGRADYEVERSCTEDYDLSAEDLLEIIRETIEGGGALGSIVDAIADRINDDAWNRVNPDLNNYGDYEYSEHDSTDSGSSEITFSRSTIKEAVLRFVGEHHPELAAEL